MVLFLAFLSAAHALSCLDPEGKEVSWFIALKSPKQIEAPPAPGESYIYFDATHHTAKFQPHSINDNSALTWTIDQLNADSEVSYVIFKYFLRSDDLPGEGSNKGTEAHMKGVLAVKDSEAFYLVHSIPEFPEVANETVNPTVSDSQLKYGQSSICISLSSDQAAELAGLMTIADPQVYASRLKQDQCNMTLLVEDVQWGDDDVRSALYPFTVGGLDFVYFAKHRKNNVDIFENMLTPHYQSGFQALTWGRPLEDSSCDVLGCFDVEAVKTLNVEEYSWKYTLEHSKWALGIERPVVCVGDLNRMESQKKRGGGFFCVEDTELHSVYSTLIQEVEDCP